MDKSLDKLVRFCKKWGKIREKKWKYILIHGCLYTGIPIGAAIYLTEILQNEESFQLSMFFASCLVFSLTGIPIGNFLYKQQENRYEELMRDPEVYAAFRTNCSSNEVSK